MPPGRRARRVKPQDQAKNPTSISNSGAAFDAGAYIHLQGWRDASAPYLALADYFGYRQKGRAASIV